MMQFIKKSVRFLLGTIWYSVAICIILLAVTISTSRYLAPMVGEYTDKAETWISDFVGQPVSIAQLNARWKGFTPHVEVNQLIIEDAKDGAPLFAFEQAVIGIDIIKSIRQRKLAPSFLQVTGVELEFETQKDGKIKLVGLKQNNKSQKNDRAIDWIFKQEHIFINNVHINWHRSVHNEQYRFENVSLELANDDNHHLIKGSFNLPKRIGKLGIFSLDFTGDPKEVASWKGLAYAKCSACRLGYLSELAQFQKRFGMHLSQGYIDSETWIYFSNKKITQVDGVHWVRSPKLLSSTKKLPESIEGQFSWHRNDDDWDLSIENFTLSHNNRAWPMTRFGIHKDNNSKEVHVRGDFIRLQDLIDIAQSLPFKKKKQVLDYVKPLKLKADINDYRLKFDLDNHSNFYVQANLNHFNMIGNEKLPEIHNLNAKLFMNNRSGMLNIVSKNTEVKWDKLFKKTILLDQVTGKILIHRPLEKYIEVEGHALQAQIGDTKVFGRLHVQKDFNSKQNLFLDVAIHAKDGDIDELRPLISYAGIPDKVENYINKAVEKGRLVSADFSIFGEPHRYPFKDGHGKIQLKLNIDNASVNYAPEWPSFTQANAELFLHNDLLTISKGSGKVFESQIENVIAEVDLLKKPAQLLFSASSQANTTDALQFLQQSPLNSTFGPFIKNSQSAGITGIDVKLEIPLAGNQKTKVEGSIETNNNNIELTEIGVNIKNLTGRVRFTEDSVFSEKGEKLTAEVWDLPMTMSVKTKSSQTGNITIIKGRGVADVTTVKKRFPLELFDYAKGKTAWNGSLSIHHGNKNNEPYSTLLVHSKLSGVKVALPEPLFKFGKDKVSFVLENTISTKENTLRFSYNNNLIRGVFFANPNQKEFAYNRGEVRIGDGPALLPRKGLRLAGSIDEYDDLKWERIFFPKGRPNGYITEPFFNDVDLFVKDLKILGYHFKDIKVTSKMKKRVWTGQLFGKQAEGNFTYPLKLRSQPIKIDMAKLELIEIDDYPISKPDPRKLAGVDANINNFVWNKMKLGNVKARITTHPRGLAFNEIHIVNPSATAKATGDWFFHDKLQSTRLEVNIEGNDMGQFLQDLGFVGSLSGSKGQLSAKMHWPGGPSSFSFDAVNGEINLDMKKGRLLDIEPGAGRIFGLLSLHSLPRRLALDFSDFFKKGFSFDTLRGSFTVSNGNAYTSDLIMEGPPAKVEVVGRTGLVNRDYDQVVTVEPKFGASLPLAGVLAGSPQLGAVMFFTQQIFNDQIKKATTFEYSISGPWQRPTIESLTQIPETSSILDEDPSPDELFGINKKPQEKEKPANN